MSCNSLTGMTPLYSEPCWHSYSQIKLFPSQLTHLVAITSCYARAWTDPHDLLLEKWNISVLSQVSTEKRNSFAWSFPCFSWSVNTRPAVASLSLEHKGHNWQVISLLCPRTSDVMSKFLADCNSNQICPSRWRHQCEQTCIFCLYITVFRGEDS